MLPLCPRTGRAASATDLKTWGSFEDALKLVERRKAHGVAFATGDYISAIDMDWKGLPHAPDWAEKIIEQMNSYTEISPSGQGVHIFLIGQASKGGRKKQLDGGSLEIYSRHRFIRVTGWLWNGVERALEWRHEQLAELEKTYWPPKPPRTETPQRVVSTDDEEALNALLRGRGHSASVLRRLMQGDFSDFADGSEDGYDLSKADFYLACCIARKVGHDPGRIRRLMERFPLHREKWKRGDYLERTIEAAIRG